MMSCFPRCFLFPYFSPPHILLFEYYLHKLYICNIAKLNVVCGTMTITAHSCFV
uniref:Uncharacterized protein n=1 Tax=Meloidogyne enterolobii TaxID=390850 RepID=A0A6V7WXU7_MELEN|nr:unnamed protein product [Meloidogyne enterolobii]